MPWYVAVPAVLAMILGLALAAIPVWTIVNGPKVARRLAKVIPAMQAEADEQEALSRARRKAMFNA